MLSVVTNDNSGAALIPPGSSVLVRFEPKYLAQARGPYVPLTNGSSERPMSYEDWHSLARKADDTSAKCEVVYHFTNFDGTPHVEFEEKECSQIANLIIALPHKEKAN